MNAWAREALGFLLIIICLIAFMFFYPALYERFGKSVSLLLCLVFFYACFWLWNWAVNYAQRSE